VYYFFIIGTNPILTDLNYRIDLPDAEVRALLNESGNLGFDALLTYDQVNHAGDCSAGLMSKKKFVASLPAE
jgi:hypothetical protein